MTSTTHVESNRGNIEVKKNIKTQSPDVRQHAVKISGKTAYKRQSYSFGHFGVKIDNFDRFSPLRQKSGENRSKRLFVRVAYFFMIHIFLTYVKIRQTPHFVCTQSPRLQSLENCRPPPELCTIPYSVDIFQTKK